MRFAFTTILVAPRFGWQSVPDRAVRLQLYEDAKRIGFDGLEWSPRWCDFHALSDDDVLRLGDEVRRGGLCVSAINLNRFILTRCEEAAEHRARLERAVQAADLLGADAVIISLSLPQPPSAARPMLTGHTIPEAEFQETAKLLQRAARQAGERDLRLILELHDDGLLDTPELCLRMLSVIDEPNVALNPDLGNLVRQEHSEVDWRDTLHRLAPHTGYWHIKSYDRGQPVPIWKGDIDYAEAIATMQQHGYDGWISIESYFGDDVMGLQQRSLDWLRTTAKISA